MKTSEPANLVGLIGYQNDSVVSMTLAAKPTGTVTLFAFDKKQSLSEHTAPFDALLCVLEGAAEVTISGNKNSLKAGDIILMPANEPHAVLAPQRMKMMLVMIRS